MIPLRDNAAPRRLTPVNIALIAANIAVFVQEIALGSRIAAFAERYALVPIAVTPVKGSRFSPIDIRAKTLVLSHDRLDEAGLTWINLDEGVEAGPTCSSKFPDGPEIQGNRAIFGLNRRVSFFRNPLIIEHLQIEFPRSSKRESP